MLRLSSFFGLLYLIFIWIPPAHASGDASCYPDWRLSNAQLSCYSIPAISPGNDTRANLLMLLRDKRGASAKADYPELGWDKSYGRNYYNWSLLRKAFAPLKPAEVKSQYGTRCQSFDSGTKAFNTAVASAKKISKSDKAQLTDLRAFISDVCDRRDYRKRAPDDLSKIVTNAKGILAQAPVKGKEAKDFVIYLLATNDFYGGSYSSAVKYYQMLGDSKNGWLRESAKYMVGRSHVNAAMQTAFNKWGFFEGVTAIRKPSALAAENAFKTYLDQYPKGKYAASANGLIRRAHWLSGDFAALSSEYQRMLGQTKGSQTADLIEEIDIKLIFEDGAGAQVTAPELLAAINLMKMREQRYQGDSGGGLSLTELEKQRGLFRGRDDLYSFLLANYALYVQRDAKKVLKLIPDAARQENFSHLQFSRQVLRGTALSVLNDRNEGGFWRDMLLGSKSLYQRPMVEMGLATFYERNGQLDKVFADNSPITEVYIRETLLEKVAGEDILRRAAKAKDRPRHERDLALFMLLHKQLYYGDYAGFLKDRKIVSSGADLESGLYNLILQDKIPVGLFGPKANRGENSCPELGKVAETLSRSPHNPGALLCLGDFWLANGFDYFREGLPDRSFGGEDKPLTPRLGSSQTQFSGTAMPRHDIYTKVMASARATADQKAYALYRAIRCYATSGSNSCGGKAAALSQRKAWFQRLKRSYPSSKWAKKLKYYW